MPPLLKQYSIHSVIKEVKMLINEFMTDDLNETIKVKDGNVFRGMMDVILNSGTGDGIKNLLKKVPKFGVRRLEIEDIDKILTRVTEAVVNKMYQTDCGDYSLRHVLIDGEISYMTQSSATNNIAYGVMSSISPYILGSLLYYVDESFIFFYIRDSIIEPNYREMIKKIRSVYDKPTEEDMLLKKSKELSVTVNDVLQNLLIDASENATTHLQTNISKLSILISELPADLVASTMENEPRYPVPLFLLNATKGSIDNLKDHMNEFITKLRVTFTKEGLRELYIKYGGIQSYGSSFEYKLNLLAEDRIRTNGLGNVIDGIDVSGQRLLHKILTFQHMEDYEEKAVSKHEILNKIKTCLKGYSSIGTACIVDNDKLTVKTSEGSKEFYYQSKNIIKDKMSPFNIFGGDRDLMERLYKTEPDKFCSNQTVINRKDRQSMVMEGRTSMFRDSRSKVNHRRNKLNQLLGSSQLKGNKEILEKINILRAGHITKLEYVKGTWFDPPVIDDPIMAALTMAEMEGIGVYIERGLKN